MRQIPRRDADSVGGHEFGRRAIALGLNHSLTSAAVNDLIAPHLEHAQEVAVLGRPGDALLAISTSRRAANVRTNAAIAARAQGPFVAVPTDVEPREMGEVADLVLSVPATCTAAAPERHELLHHAPCRVLEDRLYRRQPPAIRIA